MEKAEATIPSNDPNDPNTPATTESASYTWLADGTKASVVDQDGNGYVYLGSLIYKRLPDGTLELESTAHGSGRIVVKDDPNNPGQKLYETQYHITDHLGSVRVVINQDGEVLARNDYYPFGKSHNNPALTAGLTTPATPATPEANRFLFNGKEKQLTGNLGMLDYGARMYDNETVRWFGIDPLAEQYSSVSPYVFTLNNPVKFIDPNGLEVKNADEKRKNEAEEAKAKADADAKQARTTADNVTKNGGDKKEVKAAEKAARQAERAANKAGRAYAKANKAYENTQKYIDDMKTYDPEGFEILDNLTYKDAYGITNELDVLVSSGNLSGNNEGAEIGYIVPESGIIYSRNENTPHSINVILSYRTKVDGIMSHEGGHIFDASIDPVGTSALLKRAYESNHNCQATTNRNHPVSKTAMDWQERYWNNR